MKVIEGGREQLSRTSDEAWDRLLGRLCESTQISKEEEDRLCRELGNEILISAGAMAARII